MESKVWLYNCQYCNAGSNNKLEHDIHTINCSRDPQNKCCYTCSHLKGYCEFIKEPNYYMIWKYGTCNCDRHDVK